MQARASESPNYVPPTLVPLGAVHELTQAHIKWLGESDGFTFIVPITNVSF